jgi:hypothetical protein
MFKEFDDDNYFSKAASIGSEEIEENGYDWRERQNDWRE